MSNRPELYPDNTEVIRWNRWDVGDRHWWNRTNSGSVCPAVYRKDGSVYRSCYGTVSVWFPYRNALLKDLRQLRARDTNAYVVVHTTAASLLQEILPHSTEFWFPLTIVTSEDADREYERMVKLLMPDEKPNVISVCRRKLIAALRQEHPEITKDGKIPRHFSRHVPGIPLQNFRGQEICTTDVMILPSDWASGKTRPHRIMVSCPVCKGHIPAGRFGQHFPACEKKHAKA